jgi:type VI secretion system secreted protein Hcp
MTLLKGSTCDPNTDEFLKHLTITGIPGDSPISSLGRDNTIVVYSVCYDTEQRRPNISPITLVKKLDSATTLLYDRLIGNDVLPDPVVINYYRPNPSGDGTEENHYRITLTDAQIVEIKQVTPKNENNVPNPYEAFEEVTFVYSTITTTIINSGTETTIVSPLGSP